jgi:hypothetical protein
MQVWIQGELKLLPLRHWIELYRTYVLKIFKKSDVRKAKNICNKLSQ